MDFVVPGGQPGRAPGLRGRARIRFNPTIARTGLGCTGTSRPELTLVAAQAGLDSGDFELLQQSISRGSGPGLPRVLEAASRKLSVEDSIGLLNYSLQLGSDAKAALAIAQLAPTHLDEPAVREMLFSTLASRNLGAAAALVLGASADPEIQARLSEIASKENGLAQQRAAWAISNRRADRESGL